MHINQTGIFLIPKVDQPQMLFQFLPISLYNAIYKVVNKVIVNRLKAYIPKLGPPFQTRFISGLNIHEKIIIAKEVMHKMHIMKVEDDFLRLKWTCLKSMTR